jgi:cyclopropane fatty-acyl-phospholipid synthase-like methyltransferase
MRSENADALTDGRLRSPSAERNKGPIAGVLQRVLPESGSVLEVSSGTGQHAVHFARAMPHHVWQPTECDAACLQSIAAWLATEKLENIKAPFYLDVHNKVWPAAHVDAIVCINMIHIAPSSATNALFRGASTIMNSGGELVLYGPFRRQGQHTSPSNESFDRLLRAQNPEWGVRNLDDVAHAAEKAGFDVRESCEMPANNLTVIFRKR